LALLYQPARVTESLSFLASSRWLICANETAEKWLLCNYTQ
jgi:hypothetical protein